MTDDTQIAAKPIHPRNMTREHWIEDLSNLFSLMEENNPYLFLKERTHGYNWLDLRSRYLERMKNSESVLDYLDIISDAVQALQNRHTIPIIPDWFDSFYSVEDYRKDRPFCEIFTEETKAFYEYWTPMVNESFKRRILFNFDALLLYHNGEYRLVDGHDQWREEYGEGSIITAVNGRPIDDAVLDCYEKGILDWDFKRKKRILWKLAPRHFGADAEFTIKTTSGIERQVVFRSGYEFQYSNLFKYPEERIITEVWPEKRTGYVRIADFISSHMNEDHLVLLDFYKKVQDYGLLIIDVRGNDGGSYEPWMRNVIAPLAKTTLSSKMYVAYRSGKYVDMYRRASKINEAVSKDIFGELPPEIHTEDFTIYDYTQTVEPSREVDFKGKIVVLVDGHTFSGTDAFSLFCKETGFAKLYGTPTEGDGISDGPIFYILPNSKLLVRFTPAMGIDHTGHANEEVRVQPDVYHETKFGNHDELVEYVIEKESNLS